MPFTHGRYENEQSYKLSQKRNRIYKFLCELSKLHGVDIRKIAVDKDKEEIEKSCRYLRKETLKVRSREL